MVQHLITSTETESFSLIFLPMVQRTVSWLRDSHTLRVSLSLPILTTWTHNVFCYKFSELIIATSTSFQVIKFCCYALLALSEKIENKKLNS